MCLNILVIDDTSANRVSAYATLDHNITVVASYDEAMKEFVAGKFDVVLTDLMMPPSVKIQNKRDGWGLMPAGFGLVFKAVQKGVPRIAVVSNTNHHDHPASEWLDPFGSSQVQMNGSKIRFLMEPEMIETEQICEVCNAATHICDTCNGVGEWRGKACPQCKGAKEAHDWCPPCNSTGHLLAKDWGAALKQLLND